ncbi:hypothetical protein ANCDUO_27308, partial [Ancylostoma duodenale]
MCSSAQRKSSGHVQTGNEKRPNFTAYIGDYVVIYAHFKERFLQLYDQFVEPEQFDPRDELKRSKNAIENYLRRRAEFAY